MIRLYVPSFAPDQHIVLSPEQAHYLRHVMRNPTLIHIFNETAGEWEGEVQYSKTHAEIILQACVRPPQKRAKQSWLALSLIRPHLLHLSIEKATELGISHIQLLETDYTQVHRVNIEKLQKIAIEAVEQSEQMAPPQILAPCPFQNFLNNLPGEVEWCAALERSHSAPLWTTIQPQHAYGVIIGPEGGFSPRERDAMQSLTAVSLGPTILRAETAAIYAAVCLNALLACNEV